MYATIEATRSMLECTASVRIATEPVTVPATTLRRINPEFESTDSAAVRCLACGRLLPAPIMAVPATDAGPSAEGLCFDAGVIGDRGSPGCCGGSLCLRHGVGLERVPDLGRELDAVGQWLDRDAERFEQAGHLGHLVPVARREHERPGG